MVDIDPDFGEMPAIFFGDADGDSDSFSDSDADAARDVACNVCTALA